MDNSRSPTPVKKEDKGLPEPIKKDMPGAGYMQDNKFDLLKDQIIREPLGHDNHELGLLREQILGSSARYF